MTSTKYFIIILIALSALAIRSAGALEVPLINKNNDKIVFVDKSYESLLRPMIEDVLKSASQNASVSKVEVSEANENLIKKQSIEKLLRSEGFYAAKVTSTINDDNVIYKVTAREPYIIERSRVNSSLKNLPEINDMGLKEGKRFRAEDVLSAINKLQKHIEVNHCLWQIKVSYEATVNHQKHAAEVVLMVEPSEEVNFADVEFIGLKTIDQSYLQNHLGFENGECFNRSKVEKARLNLFKTGLIGSIDSELVKDGKQVDVKFDITERANKTIKLGGGVSSDEGVIFSGGWEHRNILGKAQKLEVSGKVSELFRTVDVGLTIPSFYSIKQSLILEGELSEENLDAFYARRTSASITLERKITDNLRASIGSKLGFSHVEDVDKDETFGLISFPFGLNYDKRDNILDPKKGWQIGAEIAPFVDTLDTRTGFVKSSVGASVYYTPKEVILKPTFALRGAIGSINGQHTDDIPSDERFYTGGGGSVRGYGFQRLGPIEGENPVGGRSFTEVSFETRSRFSDNWGGVLFIDGGNTYDDITPDFDEGVRWAYGLGARYYTDFAPIRLDVAIPLEPRQGIDDDFQFYISIGQAF